MNNEKMLYAIVALAVGGLAGYFLPQLVGTVGAAPPQQPAPTGNRLGSLLAPCLPKVQ